MSSRSNKVLGYVAFATGDRMNMLCDGDACIIAFSKAATEKHIRSLAPDDAAPYTIRKARYGDVLEALKLGAAYAFDAQSFSRFKPLAEDDLPPIQELSNDRDPPPDDEAVPLIRVQCIPA